MDKLRSSFLLHFASWPQDMNCSALPYEDRLKAISQHEQFIHFKQFCLLFSPSDNKRSIETFTMGQRDRGRDLLRGSTGLSFLKDLNCSHCGCGRLAQALYRLSLSFPSLLSVPFYTSWDHLSNTQQRLSLCSGVCFWKAQGKTSESHICHL